ncbi:hypothetical protein KIV45_28015 [Janthinobacterium lividum]|nr:hypothetical protein KIV45_28015 [Janthinobacterium lividum]
MGTAKATCLGFFSRRKSEKLLAADLILNIVILSMGMILPKENLIFYFAVFFRQKTNQLSRLNFLIGIMLGALCWQSPELSLDSEIL